jgi:hypothetical protein
MKHTKSQDSESLGSEELDSDFALEWDISHLKADFLMELLEGQLAMRVVYWFLYTHKDMLENVLCGDTSHDSHHSRHISHLRTKTLHEKSGHHHETSFTESPHNNATHQTSTATTSKMQPSMYLTSKTTNKLLKIAPRIRTTIKSVNVIHDFHYVNKYRTFDEVRK